MTREIRAKTFKSGNSVALRLPKALGIKEGTEMSVREEHGRYVVEPVDTGQRKISLNGIAGSAPGIKRLPFDDLRRDGSAKDERRA